MANLYKREYKSNLKEEKKIVVNVSFLFVLFLYRKRGCVGRTCMYSQRCILGDANKKKEMPVQIVSVALTLELAKDKRVSSTSKKEAKKAKVNGSERGGWKIVKTPSTTTP